MCLNQSAKRKAFFTLLAAEAQRNNNSTGRLFCAFFCGLLTSKLVFECFEIDPFGTLAQSDAASATVGTNKTLVREKKEKDSEMKIMCDNFARHGITVVCGDGGTCMVAAIVQALRPHYTCYESGVSSRGRSSPAYSTTNNGKPFSQSTSRQVVFPSQGSNSVSAGTKRGREDNNNNNNGKPEASA
uniref:Uncharacterized protein n=1 Tax=Lygus hesperus TaxID=30085 RepID=A0A0A9WKB3_LYGHE